MNLRLRKIQQRNGLYWIAALSPGTSEVAGKTTHLIVMLLLSHAYFL